MKSNPTIQTLDTDFSKGRLNHIQTISLEDTAKFHGHLCDGLVVGFLGLREALYQLYPAKIIDRTNTRIVSKSSPCIADIGIYLTGGRYQFNTFYVDDSISFPYIVHRIDNGLTYGVKLKPGIKPTIIEEMGNKAIEGKLTACEVDDLKKLEDDFTDKLLTLEPKEIFVIEEIENFNWQPLLKNNFIKTDVINKEMPLCKR
ncbi:formylmethanofuran dehydrogenase subunit E family protein [Flavobacterium sp. LB3P21]|uniref:formylmethanofuran dehydrogenase subunit E family protein n=1 Tax=Flavobacterium sp. LB3P21 TaxID=3401719 RepID=UPI003AB0F5BD